MPETDHSRTQRRPVAVATGASGRLAALRRGGPLLFRARIVLGVKLLLACVLTAGLVLLSAHTYVLAGLALLLILTTVVLDFSVYRVADRLFNRLQEDNRRHEADLSSSGLHDSLESLVGGIVGSFSGTDSLEVEQVRSDLYRLRSFNNQLIRLGEIAQELNAALPYRETKAKALNLSRQLLSADIVVLVAETGGEFTLEGVSGCEDGEIKVGCCSYYSRCPVRTSFRDLERRRTGDHRCSMFPPTMRSQLSMPFRLDEQTTLCLVAAVAQEGTFDHLSPVVLDTLLGHIQTSLTTAQKYDRIRREVVTDPLTNLYNRRFFEKRAEEEVARSLRNQQPVTMLMMDVDHFKRINDTYGHQTGDKVLQRIAQHLTDSVRKSDVCGRYGGEEFVLILPDTPGRNAVFLADRLRKGVADILYTGLGIPSDVSITISGGVATCPRDVTTVEDLVRRADEALYEAKSRGRNCIVQAGIPDPPFEPDPQAEASRSANIKTP
jgi:diguanylate cyclase (GGDEF)-like protein